MGEVYRARDTRLKRDVALKALPESVAGDADRMARFEREAQILASLNHPNIAQIHGIEEATSGTGRALVMEFVEGATLHQIIKTGGLAPAQALEINGVAASLANVQAVARVVPPFIPGYPLARPLRLNTIVGFGSTAVCGGGGAGVTGWELGLGACMTSPYPAAAYAAADFVPLPTQIGPHGTPFQAYCLDFDDLTCDMNADQNDACANNGLVGMPREPSFY